jgi:hypothetical protein
MRIIFSKPEFGKKINFVIITFLFKYQIVLFFQNHQLQVLLLLLKPIQILLSKSLIINELQTSLPTSTDPSLVSGMISTINHP